MESVTKRMVAVLRQVLLDKPTPKKAATPAKKTPAKRNKSATPLSNYSRGNSLANSSMSNERASGRETFKSKWYVLMAVLHL